MLGAFLPPLTLLHYNTENTNQVSTNFITRTYPIINNDINNLDSSDYIEDISLPIDNRKFPERTNY